MKVGLAKHQLQAYGKFFENYSQEINSVKSKIKDQNDLKDKVYFTEIDKTAINPVIVNYQSGQNENLSQSKLIDSDNQNLRKSLSIFFNLCNNLEYFNKKSEKFQKKFLQLDLELELFNKNKNFVDIDLDLLVIKDHTKIHHLNSEDVLIKISENMEFLCKMQFFVNSGIQAAINLLQEIVQEICVVTKNFHSTLVGYTFFGYLGSNHNEIWLAVENFLINLVKFDEILSKSRFNFYWTPYKKTVIQNFQQPNHTSKCSEPEKIGLVRILNELELFLSGFLFQSFLENVDSIKDTSVKYVTTSLNEFIKVSLQQIKKYPLEICDEKETVKLIGINILMVFQHRFCGQIEQKLFKSLLDINLKFVGITLIGKFLWNPEIFLKKHAETLITSHSKYIQEQIRLKQVTLQKKIEILPKLVKKYCIETTMWIMKCKISVSSGCKYLKIGQFKQLCILFLQGAQFAGQMNHIAKSIINSYEELSTTLNKQTVDALYKLLVLIKQIQKQLSFDSENISKIIKSVIDCLQYKCLNMIISTKKKLSAKTLSDQIVDIFSALKIIEKSLNGPPTLQRLFTINLLIESSTLQNYFSNEEFEKLRKYLSRLKFLTEFQTNLSKICDISYAVWAKEFIEIYMAENICDGSTPSSLDVVCNIPLSYKIYNRLNNDSPINEILFKLCGQIETFLRIEAHSGLPLERLNPFEIANKPLDESLIELGNSFEDSRPLLKLNVLNINNSILSFKYSVENYLSNMFYNITTINLNDKKAYEIMRCLAKHKLNLNPIDDLLTNYSLEQGKDAMQIMRDIQIFVTKFNYSMNNQYFVENSNKHKYLNTISIKHISDSLQTHGSGFINTAVNFSYQFLRTKFYMISQFLYDEQIHSRLLKEYHYFMESKFDNSNEEVTFQRSRKNITPENNDNFMYKFERAEDFNKEIRALGLSPQGVYYLDLFRQMITEVGNAMGYVRLIRCGNIHANYIETAYLPHNFLDNELKKKCTENGLSSFLLDVIETFDDNIKIYNEKDETDYFKILTNAFKPFFRSANNQHLKKFFLIVPALTVNYVDYILNAREKVSKKSNDGEITLFDDGFAMGLVCLLKLLNQFNMFDSLYWFKAVEEKFNEEKLSKATEMQNEMKKNQKDNSLLQTLTLVEKRLIARTREFSLLRDSIYSAKIFFQ